MLASQRSEPSSMFTSLTPSWAHRRAQQAAATRRACSAERTSGSVTISASGVPPRLKSTMLRVRAVDASAGADVDELGGVLLEVHAMDADLPERSRRRSSGSSYWEIW